jgi:peptidoglycan hydrolase-like protein with peptidoglycan-binding domain
MVLIRKVGWVGIAVTCLVAGMFPRNAAGSEASKETVAVTHQNEIKKMQETLRDKGHYRGKVDGVLGLRTRASIRAYQKAENLPITGQVDTQTADGLGVRPEGRQKTGNEHAQDKPSAGIKWAKGSGRTSKTLPKAVKRGALQAENNNHSQ